MEKKEVLDKIKSFYNFKSISEFARYLGVNSQNVRNWYARNNYNANLLIERCKEINPEFIITGKGEMLKSSTAASMGSSMLRQAEPGPYTVPLIPISAQGGSFNDFVVSVKDSDCEKVISPVRQVDFALTVTGDSMAPEYPSGSQVLVRKVDEKAFIEWGRVYVLDTCNGTVIKKLNPGRDESEVLCASINPDYQPFYVKLTDVYGLYRVMMCMTLK